MITVYRNKKTVLINFTKTYYQSPDEFLNGDNFRFAVEEYVKHLQKSDRDLADWLGEDAASQLVFLAKLLYVIRAEDVDHPYLKEKKKLIAVVEGFYNYWRKLERCTMIVTSDKAGLEFSNFIDADTRYNHMILDVYRHIEENLLGKKNKVYRQLNAGSNASVVIRSYRTQYPKEYAELKKIPFIDRVMLRTPLLLHPVSNKREGQFVQTKENPVSSFVFDKEQWMCYPAWVGECLIYIYIHADYLLVGLGLANLFEPASEEDCAQRKPDGIVLFGNQDKKDECVFYHDEKEDIWVGNISASDRISYFGYLKKISLTLHNLIMMERGHLPIHGSMVNITLKNKKTKGIIFMGDSGAGKSETIEAIQHLGSELIEKVEVVFDDMGSLRLKEGHVCAQGSETGAFVRLDDLDKASAYQEMDRSIFFNPESANARVVLPVVDYERVITDHKVDMFLYANNYEEKEGLHFFADLKEAKKVFTEGKRVALGTTEESGLSSTFFANPFGPVQKEKECRLLIDEMFAAMQKENVQIGEIYSHLGCADKGPKALEKAALALLEEIK